MTVISTIFTWCEGTSVAYCRNQTSTNGQIHRTKDSGSNAQSQSVSLRLLSQQISRALIGNSDNTDTVLIIMDRNYKVDLNIQSSLPCLTRAESYRDLKHKATPTEAKHRAYGGLS